MARNDNVFGISAHYLLTEEQAIAQGVRVSPFFNCETHVLVRVSAALRFDLEDGGGRRQSQVGIDKSACALC